MTANADAFTVYPYLLLLKFTNGFMTQKERHYARTVALTLSSEKVPDIQ